LHARYSRQEVIAALGFADSVKAKVTQGGILWVPQAQSDVFFVDLHKAERDYSPGAKRCRCVRRVPQPRGPRRVPAPGAC
jgi:hypothetical protein